MVCLLLVILIITVINFITLNKQINLLVPLQRSKVTNYPHWYSSDLINLIKYKKKAHIIYKQTNLIEDYTEFKRQSEMYQRLSRINYKDYIDSVENNIKPNPKSFWSYVKRSRNDHDLPLCTVYNDVSVYNDKDIADQFANFFGSTYSSTQTSYVPLYNNSNTLNNIVITKDPGARKNCTFLYISVYLNTFLYISVPICTFLYIYVHFRTFRYVSVHFRTFLYIFVT